MQLVHFDVISFILMQIVLFWCRVDEAYNVLAKFRSPADDIDKELQLISDAAEEEKVSQTKDYCITGLQTWFPVQLAFAKFLSKIKGNIWGSTVSMILALY